ncbi:hypothetical protein [Cellulosilyticum lentocellum]|uniref:Uncharacterized protein n=1 Tax=Cellulosilyticum lentocellum (strain ATCC 49066 / DSM 5427 / NCIMB 11756 / RHM5) TaxID=642492 RepID=F2JK57_CELLD|nr:hypothetical protein [Cellulosilyticum lentocellum]ADZ84472.1 hypothetical protein Clole_2773 [Cellulosilyticum lentocellum DSM 5427]
MKYLLKTEKDKPSFNYLVKQIDSFDYYLFSSFNDALEKLRSLSFIGTGAWLYEPYFINSNREWKTQNTFTAYDGVVKYDKYAEIGLHLKFHIDAGEWLNSDVNLAYC